MKGGPLHFLVIVAALWGLARSTIVWTTPKEMAEDLKSLLTWADPPAPADVITPPPTLRRSPTAMPAPALRGRSMSAALTTVSSQVHGDAKLGVASIVNERTPAFVATPTAPAVSGAAPFASIPPSAIPNGFASRVRVSSWAILRESGGTALASGGQIGGSQAGFRASAALSPTLAVAGRLSAPLQDRGAEAAIALDWRPIHSLPLTLTAERRVRIDRGGRNTFALGVFGGVEGLPLPVAFRLDGYGQAGVVGLRRRDAYIDGAIRVERTVVQAGPVTLALGGGAWGAVQPGASRLDVGPQLIARVPAGPTTLRVGLDWRERVAGDAKPGSGPALSVGADF